MSISRNGRWPSSSVSIVNCILLCSPLRWFRNSISFSCPWGQMTKVLSTYLYQHTGLCVACSTAFFSKSCMKKFAMTGKSGEPIAHRAHRVFRNIGIYNSDAGELPKRKHNIFRTRRKFEIQNTCPVFSEKPSNSASGTVIRLFWFE